MSQHEPTIEEIQKAQQGDSNAFETIVRYYQAGIYNLAYRMSYDREEAQDITQEIFLRVYQKLKKYDVKRPFARWLYRVATNVCINKLSRSSLKPISLESLSLSGRGKVDFEPENNQSDALTQIISKETTEIVQKAISELSTNYRIVVVLRYLKELSYEEISEILELPLGTVKNRLFRAREVLKDKLIDFMSSQG